MNKEHKQQLLPAYIITTFFVGVISGMVFLNIDLRNVLFGLLIFGLWSLWTYFGEWFY